MQCVDKLDKPLVYGEKYMVPCIKRIDYTKSNFIEEDCWYDYDNTHTLKRSAITSYIPIHNHPHNDYENGQTVTHYHRDTRFQLTDLSIELTIDYMGYRPTLQYGDSIVYLEGTYLYPEYATTPIESISKSKLKHKCIYKGKCPHRGYDLTHIQPINGIITCPLHSLKFNAESKKLINNFG